ncbi:FAD-dependent oxidoreductase [Nitrospira moscoviensis]|uniref:Putative glucose-methanol-choline (GMC) oxidoreductase n=1 Tax=Nitrospira moscoviensis TaxID=42253 RepID=A0A0K2GHH5_NITMO|nr:GMC family oxidoreductase [Nitrospira moscoviensis]ALA60391.1 putative glucose-methanol-choline (GMC) oxidoreductase [Nitrospira moscoviensis]
MSTSTHYDVIIIGTGPGGGTLAYKLAPSGKKILLLERGGYLPREKENWNSRTVFIENRYKAKETWRDKHGRPFHPGIHYNVGGNSKVYGAALLRMRPQDFGEVKHDGGISPEWPICYEDLEPYYTQAEHLYHVHGKHGEDPTEGPASAQYKYAPLTHEPRIQELHDDWQRMGYHPFHLPVGVMLDEERKDHSPCIRCSTCDGFPCLLGAKADAQAVCVEPALRYPNVTLLTQAKVTRLETDGAGHEVTGVVVERNGETETYKADIIVVSAGAINSAALLLKSANDRHPHGLANSSDMVGRNYMCHNNSAMLAISKRPNPTVFQKTIGLNDFYFGSAEWDYPMGHISMVGKQDLDMLRTGAPAFAPGLALDVLAKHSLDFWMTSEDLPDPDNRVLVNNDGGISLHYTENNLDAHRRLAAKLKSMLNRLGCEADRLIPQHVYLGKKIPIAGTAHQCGTVRFGRDPKTSVLDEHCKTHDLDNLYVVDASFFVSSSAVNPSLTIIANALRVGEHLLDRLR